MRIVGTRHLAWLLMICVSALSLTQGAMADESDYYTIHRFPLPKDLVLETSGIVQTKDGRILVSTRRGEVFQVDNAFSDPAKPVFKQWTFGLGQPLGLEFLDGWIYTAQRGELTRMKDSNGDGRADVFQTVCDDWAISGNYHEYAFGPRLDKDGYLWVTLNKPFGGAPYGRAHWRGWAVRIDPKTGKMHPMCNGLRSPAGVEVSPWGDVFYTDNQGEWCNASKMSHLAFGDFHGHPHGLDTTELPQVPKALRKPKSKEVPNGDFMKDVKKKVPNFKMPAIWLPYNKMGKSPSGMAWDTSGGKFGPFHGQCFIADQSAAWVMRAFLEKVDGHWQGAVFPFRDGFSCGLIRIRFAKDPKTSKPSMFAGGSNRGWGGRGNAPWNLERLEWTGKTPFEIHEMSARNDGFVLTFTKPIDKATAMAEGAFAMKSYTYRLRSAYGGPEEDNATLTVKKVTVADDGMSLRLVLDGLRAGYVHEMSVNGLKNKAGEPLLHGKAYYTLVNIPKAGQVPTKPKVAVE